MVLARQRMDQPSAFNGEEMSAFSLKIYHVQMDEGIKGNN